MKTRTERDSMGWVEVPAERYWGAQTQRALENFPIGSERMPRELIHALGLVKQAAAAANAAVGVLDSERAEAIQRAAAEVAAGVHDDEFPLVVWQSGSGTQTNMNANEVIANRGAELLGGVRGERDRLHPNDHVNRSQSSNDVIPTAMHVATVELLRNRLDPVLAQLHASLEARSKAFDDLIKVGRTHLMDATPMTLGQEFSGYAHQVRQAREQIAAALEPILELAIGGTAVGTGLNAPPGFKGRAVEELAALAGHPFVPARNTFAAIAAHDALVGASGALRTLAGALLKVANDIRWLASGPRCGLGELRLPANEPGSSIMPAKVNPTQCEALAMVCVQVVGNDTAVQLAGASGNLELNTFKPVLIHNLISSARLLAGACDSFRARCIEGLEAVPARLRENLERSLMLVTALTPHLGYDAAARIAHQAHAEDTTLRAAAIELGLLSAEQFDTLVRVDEMVHPPAGTGGS